jgi:hypothetical protein
MAGMSRPSASYEYDGSRAFGYNRYDGSNVDMRNHLQEISANDPRMTNEQRLDQRYGNFQYGPTPEYATETNQRMVDQGAFAQTTLGGMGQEAWQTGAGIQGRATPGTDFDQTNRQLSRVGDVGTDQGRLYDRLINYGNQGPGPSLAQAQLEANTGDALRQQMMLAGSGRGAGGSAATFRQAGQNQAVIQGNANADAASLAAQEADLWRGRQLEAYGMGGNVLSQQGALGMQQAQEYAGQAQFLTQAEMEAQAQRDTAGLGYQQLGLGGAQQSFGTQLGYEQQGMATLEQEARANQAYEENLTNIAVGRMNQQRNNDPGTLDTLLGVASVAAPLMMAMSDEREKKGVRDSSLSDTYRALGGEHSNADDFTDEGWMQQGPEGWMHNGAEWKAKRDAERQQEEQQERWKRLEQERDEAKAAADKKRADTGNLLGNALNGLRAFV